MDNSFLEVLLDDVGFHITNENSAWGYEEVTVTTEWILFGK